MSGTQLKKLLKEQGLTVEAAAQKLGMSERQIYRYLSGTAVIPQVVELALKHR